MRGVFIGAVALISAVTLGFAGFGLWRVLAGPDWGACDLRKGDAIATHPDPIIADCTRVLASSDLSDSDRSWAYFGRGTAELAKDPNAAIHDLGYAIRINPANAYAWINRGRAWAAKHDDAKALADYGEAAKREQGTFALSNRLALYAHDGDLVRALADADRIVALKPKNPTAYMARAWIWSLKHDRAQAIADYGRAIAVNPAYRLAYVARAVNLSAQGEEPAAAADLDRVLALKPDDADALRQRGVLRLKLGMNSQALEDFNKALKIDPNFDEALVDRAAVRLKLGDVRGAGDDAAAALAVRRIDASLVGDAGDQDLPIRTAHPTVRALALYLRGASRMRLGQGIDGLKDVAAAKALDSGITQHWRFLGVS
jgi:tetratricopeptide (TPR) repeat protein